MDLKDIKAIIDLMRKNNLSEFELERQDFKIKLKRAASGPPAVEEPGYYPVAPAAAASASAARPRRRRRQPAAGGGGGTAVAGNRVSHDRHVLPGAFAGIATLRGSGE